MTFPCGRCGQQNLLEDLRPYGPEGELICFTCGMKDERTTAKQYIAMRFGRVLTDAELDVIMGTYEERKGG